MKNLQLCTTFFFDDVSCRERKRHHPCFTT